MFISKVLICVFVIYNSACVNAKDCNDCVTIRDCKNALDLATVRRDDYSKRMFQESFCGFDNNVPKVCCSEFPVVQSDTVENHRNLNLLPKSCGDIDGSRIVGGRVAKLYEFPWMALISYRTRTGLQFQCGGSIINERYILTAAHCVVPAKKIAGIRIGEFDVSKKVDCQDSVCESKLQDILVEEIISHPNYTGQPPVQYDIALVRLNKAIDLTWNNAAPICLPVTKDLRDVVLAGKMATVAGWGFTEAGTDSDVLLKVEIPIQTGDSCRFYYNRNSLPGSDRTDKILCAGEYKKDSCSGDSGGPMMIESEYNGAYRYVQYGIISYGPKQCGSNFPGVYTDLTKYVTWILDNIKS